MIEAKLAAPPFNLDREALAWVRGTFDRLTLEEKVGQLFVLIVRGHGPEAFAEARELKPGGITRFFGPATAEDELANFRALADVSAVPPVITADLEGSRLSLPFGSEVLNPLGLAAVDDVEATRAVCRIIAEEAHAIGIRWSFTPVVDVNAAFRSAIVATRAYGSDIDRIERHSLTQLDAFQKAGVAATVKHWPGEGYDDRDQHLVTTVIPQSMTEWEKTSGRIYRAAIDAGVMSVMSAHIAFPAFVRSLDPNAGIEAFRPASISKILTTTLLRERLGFNGIIISDATPMAGLNAWCSYDDAMPQLINAGCDVILFPPDPAHHMAIVRKAVEDGTISEARFTEAVMRVLGLKAAVGLPKAETRTDAERVASIGSTKNRAASNAVTRRAPTLVKDTQKLLPLDKTKHKRVMVITPGIIHPLFGASPFAMPDMLRAEGFEVTLFAPGTAITRENFDLVLYLFGEETLLGRSRIFIDWLKLAGGDLHGAFSRTWHDVPTAMISFGYPYFLYDAPRVPTYINAYATMDTMQRAVVDAMLGRIPWNRNNPVDPFVGLEDAHY